MQQRTEAPAAVEQAAPVVQTPPAPTPAPGGDFNPTQWLGGLTPEQRAAVDDYSEYRRKPLESENHGLKTEVGRYKKLSDPAIVARYSNEERLLEQHKAAVVALYGVDAKKLESIDSIDALNVAMQFMDVSAKQPAPKPAATPAGVDPNDWSAYLAFKQGQAPAAPARPPLAPGNGGGYGPPAVTADNIDALYMDAELKGLNPNPYAAQYNKFLATGQL